MTSTLNATLYPSGDGKPVAETFVHLYAIFTILAVLRQYLDGQQATVLANQFLYYVPGMPAARVAPDVMVIFDVAPGPRDNYKIWEECQVPAVVFEVTSAGTRDNDKTFKKRLYAQLGVREYWLFDPKGEWIPGQLQGYRLHSFEEDGESVSHYEPIADGTSWPLALRLAVEGTLISFYRLDSGQKLLIPDELAAELQRTAAQLEQEQRAREQAETELVEERQAREQERQQAAQRLEQAEQRAAQLAERLRALGIDPESA